MDVNIRKPTVNVTLNREVDLESVNSFRRKNFTKRSQISCRQSDCHKVEVKLTKLIMAITLN